MSFLTPRIRSISFGPLSPAFSSSSMSVKPPMRLAMSPPGKGSPSKTVTMPIVSIVFSLSACTWGTGSMRVTSSCCGVSPKAAGSSV